MEGRDRRVIDGARPKAGDVIGLVKSFGFPLVIEVGEVDGTGWD